MVRCTAVGADVETDCDHDQTATWVCLCSFDSCVDAGWNAIGVDFCFADNVVKGWTATVISWTNQIVCTFVHLRNSIGWVQL